MQAILTVLLKSFLVAKRKFVLCVLAAILSSWGVSVVVYSYMMSERDFKENFNATLPPDLILSVEGNVDQISSIIGSNADVELHENREALSGRIKNKSGNWMSFILFVAQHPGEDKLGKLKIVSTVDSLQNKIFIEQNAINFLNIGDSLKIQLSGTDVFSFNYGGKIFDPSLPPAVMDQVVYAFTDFTTARPLLNDKQHRFIIRVKDEARSVDNVKEISKKISEQLEKNGNHVTRQFIPPPGEHPHQNIVDGISFLQKSFGISLSVLGVILLSLILITWLYPQVVTIGISKAIGASTKMIFKAYVSVLLIILSLGALVGLPLGYMSAAKYNGFIAFLQNFTPVTTPFPWQVGALVLLLIFALPLIVTIVPLLKFSSKSVHDSMNQVFYTRYKGMFRFSQNLFSSVPFKYSFNNLFRNNQRTLLLLVLLVMGVALLTGGFNLRYSLRTEFTGFINNSAYDMNVALRDSVKQSDVDFVKNIPAVKEYSFFKANRITFKSVSKPYFDNGILITLFDDYKINNQLVMQGQIKKDCNECIYLGQKMLSEFKGIKLGDTISIKTITGQIQQYKFSGVIKELVGPASFYRLASSPSGYFTNISIKKKDEVPATSATQQIDDAFLAKNFDVKGVSSSEGMLTALDNHLQPMYLIIQVMGYVTIVIAFAGLLIVLSLSLQERAREIGIMKSIGSSVGSITLAFQREFFAITFTAAVLGVIAGQMLNSSICKLFGVMLIELEIPSLVDVKSVTIAMAILFALQFIAIQSYIRFKMRQSSNRLLTEVY
jgi:putative ABC transport system permease protein